MKYRGNTSTITRGIYPCRIITGKCFTLYDAASNTGGVCLPS